MNQLTIHHERIFLFLVTCVATFLLFSNLGNQYLWQDEAQTATISKTILTHGIPLGYDGKNHFSQEFGVDYGDNYIWKWHTWLSFYLVAGAFKIFGVNTLAARLPFALLGIATIVLTYVTSKALLKERRTAMIATVLVLVSVPFLILSRQSRYYSATMFFSLLCLFSYGMLLQKKKYAAPLYVAALTLLFHTHYIYSATMLAAVIVHAVLYQRERLRAALLVSAGAVLLNLPWIIWLSSIKYGNRYSENLFSVEQFFKFGQSYYYQIGEFIFPPMLLIIPAFFGVWEWVKQKDLFTQATLWKKIRILTLILILLLVGFGILLHIHFYAAAAASIFFLVLVLRKKSPIGESLALLVLFIIITLTALLLSIPSPFFRYLAPLIPVFCILIGYVIEKAMRVHVIFGIEILLITVLWINPLHDFLYEVTHDYDGPIEGIVNYLRANGASSDTVVITYGDLPLKFYTDMKVVGGLTGESVSPYTNAQWIIFRKTPMSIADTVIRHHLKKHVDWNKYREIKIGYPDIPWENREEPQRHLYRTAMIEDSVTLFRRIE